jgi:peptidyl-prolyl cis-trans isomerase C
MIKKYLSDPLFAFMIIGLMIFSFYHFKNRHKENLNSDEVVFTDSDIDRLVELYERTWSVPPDNVTILKLIDDQVKEEMMYREGLKLNLDHNDEIIKRRLVQKYEFLIKDLADVSEPTEAELEEFYSNHSDAYQSSKTLTFRHYYFSPDRSDDPRELAQRYFEKWKNSATPQDQMGAHPFFIVSPQRDQDIQSLWQNFGKKFGDQLMQVDQLGWYGPIESGLGWHILFIDEIKNPQLRAFEEVTQLVTADYKAQQLIDYNSSIVNALRADYKVRLELDKWKSIRL